VTQSEPAAVLQALVERINPLTPAEAARDLIETLAGLVTRAATQGNGYTADLAHALHDAQTPIYEAMQGMPRAAPRSAPQGTGYVVQSIDAGGAVTGLSDAHSPGTGGAPDDPLRRFIAEVDRYAEERQRRGLPNYDLGGADGLPLRAGTGKRWACPRCGHDLEASIALVGPEWKGEP